MSNEVSFRDGGSGGMQLAAHQSLDADPGPMEYAEASSSLERELDEELVRAKSEIERLIPGRGYRAAPWTDFRLSGLMRR